MLCSMEVRHKANQVQDTSPSPLFTTTWFHTPWTVQRTISTHLAYKTSNKPTKVDDSILRAEMETLRVLRRTKTRRRLCFLYPLLRMICDMLFRKCWIVSECLENTICQSWKSCWQWSIRDITSSRPLWFLNLMPTCFCPRTSLHELQIQ